MQKIPQAITDVLEETKLRYEVRDTKDNTKIFVAGQYAGFVPRNGFSMGHGQANVIAAIRRIARHESRATETVQETTPMNHTTKIKDFSEMPRYIAPPSPTPTPQTSTDNAVTLLREILAIEKSNADRLETLEATCELILEVVTPAGDKPKRFTITGVRKCVLDYLRDGVARHLFEIQREVITKGFQENSASGSLSALVEHGTVERVREGVYKITDQASDLLGLPNTGTSA